jgi:hypothetical protein
LLLLIATTQQRTGARRQTRRHPDGALDWRIDIAVL